MVYFVTFLCVSEKKINDINTTYQKKPYICSVINKSMFLLLKIAWDGCLYLTMKNLIKHRAYNHTVVICNILKECSSRTAII